MNLPFEFCWKKKCTIELGFDDSSSDATGTAHIPSGRAEASLLKSLMCISAVVCGLLKAFKLHVSRVRENAWEKKNGNKKKKKKQKIFHLGVLGVGEQAGAACRGAVAFVASGITGILFQLCPVGAWVWHRLRSGGGNVTRGARPKAGSLLRVSPSNPMLRGQGCWSGYFRYNELENYSTGGYTGAN